MLLIFVSIKASEQVCFQPQRMGKENFDLISFCNKGIELWYVMLFFTGLRSRSSTSMLVPVENPDLEVGDEVMISGSSDSRQGIIRYRGTTRFAPGKLCFHVFYNM